MDLLFLRVIRVPRPVHLGNEVLETLSFELFAVLFAGNAPVFHLFDPKVRVFLMALLLLGNESYPKVGVIFALSPQEVCPRRFVTEGDVALVTLHVAHVKLKII